MLMQSAGGTVRGNIPQSHLSENPEEVELVRRLMPEAEFYGDGNARFRHESR